MSLSELCLILVLISVFALYWRLHQHRQQAVIAVKKYCQQADVQLLDDSISFIGLKRGDFQARNAWGLAYQFEFATDGEQRYNGRAWFYRYALVNVELEPHRFSS